ncbi:MAG: hypothetical protein ACLFST_15515 [Spirochaetia bacterium]
MNTRINKVYFIIPVLYIGVIFLLLFLQFSGGEFFSEAYRGISVSGSFETVPEQQEVKRIAELKVERQGISFNFGSNSPLQFINDDGAVYVAALVDYTSLDNGFELIFEGNIIFQFIINSTDDMEIVPILPPGIKEMESVRLPFEFRKNADYKDTGSTVTVTVDSSAYDLYLPPDTELHNAEEYISIPLESLASHPIRYIAKDTVERDTAETTDWYSRSDIIIDFETYQETINTFLSSAYAGWKTNRYDSRTGTWLIGDEREFKESILTAYLAESLERNEYSRAFNEMRTTADKHPNSITMLSAPFLGNVERKYRAFNAEADQELSRISELIETNNPELFQIDDLFAFVLHNGSHSLYQKLINFTSSIELARADTVTALGMVKNYLDFNIRENSAKQVLSRFPELISQKILDQIKEIDEKIFLQYKENEIDLYHSIKAGYVLMNYGKSANDQTLINLGRNLISDSLSFTDESGILPEKVNISSGRVTDTAGMLTPEDIYLLLSENPYYPHTISLFEHAGRGAFIWTTAQIEVGSPGSGALRFTINFPEDRTTYITIAGFPSYRSMYLFNHPQPWRSDRNYEAYWGGYFYDNYADAFYIKYFNREVRGQFTINY